MIGSENSLLHRLNAVLCNLHVQIVEEQAPLMRINAVEVLFPPRELLEKNALFDRWWRNARRQSTIHEPGTVGALVFLSQLIEHEEIDFFDIGALFGYFSLLAQAFFAHGRVHAIEADPAHYETLRSNIEAANTGDYPISAHNCFISGSQGSRSFLHSGFSYFPLPEAGRNPAEAKSVVKRMMADVREGKGQIKKVEQTELVSFLEHHAQSISRPVLKIDTEGHQADFLPPASSYLIDRRAIILLEFDGREKLQHYNTSNLAICAPFFAADYTIFWLDHRVLHQPAIKLDHSSAGTEVEKNSLAILLPPDICR